MGAPRINVILNEVIMLMELCSKTVPRVILRVSCKQSVHCWGGGLFFSKYVVHQDRNVHTFI